MKNKVLSVIRRSIPYVKELRPIAGSVTAAILLQQLDFWFEQNPDGFYKFLEPCEHSSYKTGDSWTEELGFSPDEFRGAYVKIGTHHKSKRAFDAASDKFQGKYFCSYHDRQKGLTFYFRNHKLLDQALDRLTETDNPNLCKWEKSIYVNGKSPFLETDNSHLLSYTEITSESTQRSHTQESEREFVSLTELEPKPPSVNPPQKKVEQGSAAPVENSTRYLSGAEKVNRHFAAPQMPWGDYLRPDADFLAYLLKSYLPKVPSNAGKELGLSDARRWLNGAKFDEQRRDNALIEWESFLERRDRPSNLSPEDWEHSPRRAEYEALYNSLSLRAFLFPNLESGDRTTPPDRQSFYNYLQKIGAA